MGNIFHLFISGICIGHKASVPSGKQLLCVVSVSGHGIVEQNRFMCFVLPAHQDPHEGIGMCLSSRFMITLDTGLICMDHLTFLQHMPMQDIDYRLQPFLAHAICPVCHVLTGNDDSKVTPHIFLTI